MREGTNDNYDVICLLFHVQATCKVHLKVDLREQVYMLPHRDNKTKATLHKLEIFPSR